LVVAWRLAFKLGVDMARIKAAENLETIREIQDELKIIKKRFGTIPNIYKILAIRPQLFCHFSDARKTLMESSGVLEPRLRYMVAVLVSRIINCHYAYSWFSLGLRQQDVSYDVVSAISQDFRAAPIPEQEKAILAYADKLIRSPFSISDREFERLRILGFSEEAVLETTMLVGFAETFSRMTLALGIELEC